MSQDGEVYTASKPDCGCIVAATVIDQHEKRTAAYVAEWIYQGLLIDRMKVSEFRAAIRTKPFGCEHNQDEPQMDLPDIKLPEKPDEAIHWMRFAVEEDDERSERWTI